MAGWHVPFSHCYFNSWYNKSRFAALAVAKLEGSVTVETIRSRMNVKKLPVVQSDHC
jgi:hypothetical protein